MPTSPDASSTFSLDQVDLDGFARDVAALRREIRASLGPADLAHLRRIERWGRVATALGWLTAWIAPNPVSAGALALGRSTRWLLMHHVGHRGYDHVPGVPRRYTSKAFARGVRRFVDWPDWMLPAAWIYEHNVLHHQHTGEARDPDLIERNVEFLDARAVPKPLRWALLAVLALTWRASYYAPKTLAAWRRRHDAPDDAPTPVAGALWMRGYLPYALLVFGLLPLAFTPLGPWAVLSALVNSLLGDVLCNLHTFFVVGPNHTGDDVFRFADRPASRGEHLVRQVIGSVNYRTGGDVRDFGHLWLNYQIEHHLFPDLPMRQYQRIQPRVETLCARYGVPYRADTVTRRFAKMARVFVGDAAMRSLPAEPPHDLACAAMPR